MQRKTAEDIVNAASGSYRSRSPSVGRHRSRTPEPASPGSSRRRRTPSASKSTLTMGQGGWACPIIGCNAELPGCHIRPVEYRTEDEDSRPSYYYCDGDMGKVSDMNCSLVQHLLQSHHEYLATDGGDIKAKKRAAGQVWRIPTCSCGFQNKDGTIQVGHFLSSKHHNIKHYRCTMKRFQSDEICNGLYSTYEEFRKHYVEDSGPHKARQAPSRSSSVERTSSRQSSRPSSIYEIRNRPLVDTMDSSIFGTDASLPVQTPDDNLNMEAVLAQLIAQASQFPKPPMPSNDVHHRLSYSHLVGQGGQLQKSPRASPVPTPDYSPNFGAVPGLQRFNTDPTRKLHISDMDDFVIPESEQYDVMVTPTVDSPLNSNIFQLLTSSFSTLSPEDTNKLFTLLTKETPKTPVDAQTLATFLAMDQPKPTSNNPITPGGMKQGVTDAFLGQQEPTFSNSMDFLQLINNLQQDKLQVRNADYWQARSPGESATPSPMSHPSPLEVENDGRETVQEDFEVTDDIGNMRIH